MGWQNRAHMYSRQKYCFIVQKSHQLKGREGEHLHHHLLIVAYLCILETKHSPSQLPCPVEEGSVLKFSQAPGSRLQWLNSEESRGPRAQAESLWKGQHWESPSSLETRIYLDQNIPSTITKIKQKYHSSSRSGSLTQDRKSMSWPAAPGTTAHQSITDFSLQNPRGPLLSALSDAGDNL